MTSDDVNRPAKISLIYTTRSKVRDALLSPKFRDCDNFSIHDVSLIFISLIGCFPSSCRNSGVFAESLHRTLENFLIGRKYSPRLEHTLIAVLAGNVYDMAAGICLSPPVTKTADDYCLACVNSVYPVSSECNSDFNILIEILTGNLAGYEMEFPIRSDAMLKRLMSKAGLSTRGGDDDGRNRIHPRYLAGCFLFVIPSEEEDRVRIRDIGSSSAIKSRNKGLYRLRTEGRVCPNSFEWPCSVCPVGLTGCQLATHQLNCIRGICPICGEEEWLDVENQHVASFDCQDRLWYA